MPLFGWGVGTFLTPSLSPANSTVPDWPTRRSTHRWWVEAKIS